MKIENSEDLRTELIGVFAGLKAKKITLNLAKELCNTAGKIIDTVKIELVYAGLTKERPNSAFLVHSTLKADAPASVRHLKQPTATAAK